MHSNQDADLARMFSQSVPRLEDHADKWQRYAGQDVIPMWVADMDLASPKPIIEALQARVSRGHFGYTKAWPSLQQAVCAWIERQHGWAIDPSWLVWLPGVVQGFNAAQKLWGSTSNQTVIQTPNYPPLRNVTDKYGHGQRLVGSILEDSVWRTDWNALEVALNTPETRLLHLCNPMNPEGTMWRQEEMARLAELCERNDVIVCSDEIHADLILDNSQHFPVGAQPSLTQRSVTLMAASKTFNIAGLACAFAIIPNAQLRTEFKNTLSHETGEVNLLGLVAAEVAFTHCDAWHSALLQHLRQQRDQLATALKGTSVLYHPASATHLAWLDCRQWAVDPYKHMLAHGLGLSDGHAFGCPGFLRLNFACGTDLFGQALERLTRAVAAAPLKSST